MNREEIRQTIADHKKELNAFGVRSLSLFGSSARGEAAEQSDIDLLVEFSEPVGLFRFLDVKDNLENWLQRRVDLVTPDALKRQLRERILEEAIHVL